MILIQSSGVKLSDVTFKNVKGTSSTQAAMKFDCSPSNPCTGIKLHDIKLTYNDHLRRPAFAYCKNARGTHAGKVVPRSCIWTNLKIPKIILQQQNKDKKKK